MAFIDSRDFVRNMIYQGIGLVTALWNLGNGSGDQRRNVLWFARHPKIGTDQINMKRRPGRRSNTSIQWNTNTAIANMDALPCLEAKPVARTDAGSVTQISLSNIPCRFPVNIDVKTPSRHKIPGEQRRSSLDHPAVVYLI